MGEPLFLAQPPTGYPDVGASWISPDMLLTRMNFAADLIANRLAGARVQPSALRRHSSFRPFDRSGRPFAGDATRFWPKPTIDKSARLTVCRAGISKEVNMNPIAPFVSQIRRPGLCWLSACRRRFSSAPRAPNRNGRGKVLVVVFQRGAMDGLNVVIPFKDRAYYALRPSIAVAEPAVRRRARHRSRRLFTRCIPRWRR